jgi:hypothetical protein
MSRIGGKKPVSPKARVRAGRRKKPIKLKSADWYEKAARSVAINPADGTGSTAGDELDSPQDAPRRR